MLRNYFTIAFRNLWRYRFFTSINMVGLALGIATSLLIGLWVEDELSVDAFHANGAQLYRVMARQRYHDGQQQAFIYTPGPLYQELKKQFPEVIHASVFTWWDNPLTFQVRTALYKESGRYASQDFFRMFSYDLLAGKAETALESASGVAISEKLASKYFGSPRVAMGQTIRIENRKDYHVTAVFRDVPFQSSYQFDFVLPWQEFLTQNAWARDWNNSGPTTFLQIRPDADAKRLEAKLKLFLKAYQKEDNMQLFLQPYGQGYLYATFRNGQQQGGRIDNVWLFSAVAVFILLIACINFMNLSTAQSFKRAKEAGVRKVIGAVPWDLFRQFMGEALLLTQLAVMLGLTIVAGLLPVFNELMGKHLRIPLGQPAFLFCLLGLTLLTGLVAGSYPALLLSSLNPVRILKGTRRLPSKTHRLRQALVVVQFSISILLIVGTLVIYQQVRYLQHKKLGYDRQDLFYIPLEGDLPYPSFKRELSKMAGIVSVTRMTQLPIHIGGITWEVQWEGKAPKARISFMQNSVGYDFMETLRIRLLKGRDFSTRFAADSSSYLINETAARVMGLPDPVGQSLTFRNRPGKIVGLMQDFHFQPLHTAIEPLLIWLQEETPSGWVMIRIQPSQVSQALRSVASLARKMNPKVPFTCYSVDQEYGKLYGSEQVIGQLSGYFALVGIFLSCLGLLGLATVTTERRAKEIGIRKVLGASTTSIMLMLCKVFLKLVLLANVIALPLAGWLMQQWLKDFAYRTQIDWWIFAVAGGGSLLITLLTISSRVIKVSLANPIESLRTE